MLLRILDILDMVTKVQACRTRVIYLYGSMPSLRRRYPYKLV